MDTEKTFKRAFMIVACCSLCACFQKGSSGIENKRADNLLLEVEIIVDNDSDTVQVYGEMKTTDGVEIYFEEGEKLTVTAFNGSDVLAQKDMDDFFAVFPNRPSYSTVIEKSPTGNYIVAYIDDEGRRTEARLAIPPVPGLMTPPQGTPEFAMSAADELVWNPGGFERLWVYLPDRDPAYGEDDSFYFGREVPDTGSYSDERIDVGTTQVILRNCTHADEFSGFAAADITTCSQSSREINGG